VKGERNARLTNATLAILIRPEVADRRHGRETSYAFLVPPRKD
jgi:hypothetical protein